MSISEWVHTYTAHLPPELRPAPDDTRFTRAAREAHTNGWHAKKAAEAVTARGYTGATNPRILALIRLEQLATTNPQPPPATSTWTPPDPKQAARPEHIPERVQLLRRLNAAGVTDQTAHDAMTALIAEQRDRR